MRVFLRIVVVCLCAVLVNVCCDEAEDVDSLRSDGKDDITGLPSGTID